MSFNRDTYNPTYTFMVALTLNQSPVNADSAQLSEPVGMGYARVALPFNTATWTPSGFSEVATNADITFAAATNYWGTLYGWALLTNEATPNTVAVGDLATPYRVTAGIQPVLPAGTLSIGLY